jgi:hypothetical protein
VIVGLPPDINTTQTSIEFDTLDINKDIHKETNRNQGSNIKPEKILPDSILLYEKDSFSSKLTSNLSYFKKDLKETQDRNKKALKLKLDQILFQEKLPYIDQIE